jgi:hypothetical protein
MNLIAKPSVADLLQQQRHVLDTAFGEADYRIEAPSSDSAVIQLNSIEVRFGRERDGNIGALVLLRNPPENSCGDAGTEQWAKFLGKETAVKSRGRNGKVEDLAEDQLKNEIELIGRLIREIFSNPQRTRDAVYYVEGYTRAYNDWASGKW